MMDRFRKGARAAFLLAALVACGSEAGHPAGWTDAGNQTWTSNGQTFQVRTQPFSGTLKDLAGQQTINVVLQNPGVHLVNVLPFPDCPGLGGLATFTGGKPPRTLEQAFVIRESQATLVSYTRPHGAPADQAAIGSMRSIVCHQTV